MICQKRYECNVSEWLIYRRQISCFAIFYNHRVKFVTLLLQPAFSDPAKRPYISIYKKNVNVVIRYKVNGHILKSQTEESLGL